MSLEARFAARLTQLLPAERPPRLAVAVSGGGDSMALLHLAHAFASGSGIGLAAVTVDHGLRPEAAAEAALAAEAARDLGLPHALLRWQGWDGRGNLQAAARDARRRLLAGWARETGIDVVLTGHTLDDQAETVLMRLARGSGVDGLGGIAPSSRAEGVTWLRPLLEEPRAALRRYLADRGIGWAEDPSNDDPRFDRVRARSMLAPLARLGLTRRRLADTALHMRGARDVLDAAMRALAANAVRQEAGDLLIDVARFAAAAPETRTRLLAAALMWVGGARYRPRFAPLAALADRRHGSLAGCLLRARGDSLRLFREFQAVRDLAQPPAALWDNRWRLDGPATPAEARIRPLGPAGLALCPRPLPAGRPRAALHADPALWLGDKLLAAPTAGLANGYRLSLDGPRADFGGWLASR